MTKCTFYASNRSVVGIRLYENNLCGPDPPASQYLDNFNYEKSYRITQTLTGKPKNSHTTNNAGDKVFRFILTILMVAIFPFALKAQETKATVYPFMGYTLGKDETRLALKEIAIAAGTSCHINVTGFADGTPYKTNNKEQNQDLADRRAGNVTRILNEIEKIELGRIHAKGIAVPQRGPQYRGVMISLDCPVASAPPNDSLATVTKAVDTLNTDMQSAKKDISALKDTTAQIAGVVQKMIDNSNADSGKKEEAKKNESWIDLAVGPGYGISGGRKRLSTFTFGVGFFAKARVVPFELTGRVGYSPRGQSRTCSQANKSFDLGIRRDISGPFGLTAGGGHDEITCTSGTEGVNGNWVQQNNYGRLGLDAGLQIAKDTRAIWNLDITYGQNTLAKTPNNPTKGIGWRLGAMLRWTPSERK